MRGRQMRAKIKRGKRMASGSRRHGEPEGFMAQDFTGTGIEPRRRMREGYRIYDAAEKMWLECRLWYEGLGWIDFWTHKGARAQRFAGAKSARRMARDLQADRIGELLIVNRKGVVM